MSGLSNSDKPSSITGVKGNEMQLRNFAYTLDSGFGKWDFMKDLSSSYGTKTFNSFQIKDYPGGYVKIVYVDNPAGKARRSFKIRVTGFSDITDGWNRRLFAECLQEDGNYKTVAILKDGDYVIPECVDSDVVNNKMNFYIQAIGGNYYNCNITITQLDPDYEGALVFDGVDDYGICNNLPILTDYTVICRRVIIKKESGSVASKRNSESQWNGAFVFERNGQLTSFGQNNYRAMQQDEVSYMTATSYNGNTISRGSLQDTQYLILGADGFNIDLNRAHGFSDCAIYYFALYDKSLTPEEIEIEKERLNEEWLKRKN